MEHESSSSMINNDAHGYSKMVFMSKDCEEMWDKMNSQVRKTLLYLSDQTCKEIELKIMHEECEKIMRKINDP